MKPACQVDPAQRVYLGRIAACQLRPGSLESFGVPVGAPLRNMGISHAHTMVYTVYIYIWYRVYGKDIRISLSGSKAQYKKDTRNHVL